MNFQAYNEDRIGGEMMKLVQKIAFYYLLFLGLFLVMMSFDVFEMDQYTFWQLIGAFFVHAIPGILTLLAAFLLRKKPIILGIFMIGFAIFFFFFFHFYTDILQNLSMIVVMIIPLLFFGTCYLIKPKLNS